MIQAFCRGDAEHDTLRLRLHGLDPAARFSVTNLDAPDQPVPLSGRELSDAGLPVRIADHPGMPCSPTTRQRIKHWAISRTMLRRLRGSDFADSVQYNGQPAVNNSSSVTWKTKLKPGEKFEPSVAYHYFTRH